MCGFHILPSTLCFIKGELARTVFAQVIEVLGPINPFCNVSARIPFQSPLGSRCASGQGAIRRLSGLLGIQMRQHLVTYPFILYDGLMAFKTRTQVVSPVQMRPLEPAGLGLLAVNEVVVSP